MRTTCKITVRFLEVHYVPVYTWYDEEGKQYSPRSPIGRHSINCECMPQELQDTLVDFIVDAEDEAQNELS